MAAKRTSKGSSPGSLGMEAFFTRSAANDGIDVPLYTPAGQKTEHKIRIRGIDSDEFRLADAEGKRRGARIAELPTERERDVAILDLTRELIASLVVSWTFPQPCTRENIIQFLVEAPQIADALDMASTRRVLFFAKRSKTSSDTQELSLPSTSSQMEAVSQSESTLSR